jgi:hypothetical protein
MSNTDKPQNAHSDAELNEIAAGAGTMTRRRFLMVLAAVGASPLLTTMGCTSMHHGFENLSKTLIPTTDQVMRGHVLIRTNDGGYFAAFVCMSDMDFCWFDAQGNLIMTTKQSAWSEPWCALQTKDGSIFVAGNKCTDRNVWGLSKEVPDKDLRDWPYLQKIDANGNALPYSIHIPYKESRACSINQLLEVEDGMIFIGSKFFITPKEIPGKPLAEYVPIAAPWIFKVLSDGTIAWEHVITDDKGDYVTVFTWDEVAELPIVDAKGNITVIFKGRVLVENAAGLYGLAMPINDTPFRIVVVKLDPSGKILAKNRFLDNTPLCAAYHAGQIRLLTSKGFTVYSLDDQLQVIEQHSMTRVDKFIPYVSAPGIRADELILYGDDGGAHAALTTMDKTGKVGPLMQLGRGTTLRGMVAGDAPGEVAILYTPSAGIPPFQHVANSGMVFARYRQVI